LTIKKITICVYLLYELILFEPNAPSHIIDFFSIDSSQKSVHVHSQISISVWKENKGSLEDAQFKYSLFGETIQMFSNYFSWHLAFEMLFNIFDRLDDEIKKLDYKDKGKLRSELLRLAIAFEVPALA